MLKNSLQTNQMDQTDRACTRHADVESLARHNSFSVAC
jgi:hypothetical protein